MFSPTGGKVRPLLQRAATPQCVDVFTRLNEDRSKLREFVALCESGNFRRDRLMIIIMLLKLKLRPW